MRHINVGMSLMRKKIAKLSSCPFRSQRLAFLDFSENPRNFDWSSETNRRFGVHVDDVYIVLNIKNVHWIALAVSALHRHIEVYDNIISFSNDDEITEFVKSY
ncbi:unnamed protein product, partial [Thlaspi arvense]